MKKSIYPVSNQVMDVYALLEDCSPGADNFLVWPLLTRKVKRTRLLNILLDRFHAFWFPAVQVKFRRYADAELYHRLYCVLRKAGFRVELPLEAKMLKAMKMSPDDFSSCMRSQWLSDVLRIDPEILKDDLLCVLNSPMLAVCLSTVDDLTKEELHRLCGSGVSSKLSRAKKF